MKKLALLLSCIILISISCKKEKSLSITPAPVISSYTMADSAISGNWILDTVKVYNNGLAPVITYHNDPVNCHLNLLLSSTSLPLPYKDCIYGLNCTNMSSTWKLELNLLTVYGSGYTIILQSVSHLIIQNGSIGPGTLAQKLYFHK